VSEAVLKMLEMKQTAYRFIGFAFATLAFGPEMSQTAASAADSQSTTEYMARSFQQQNAIDHRRNTKGRWLDCRPVL
jgi:hypothetical protein